VLTQVGDDCICGSLVLTAVTGLGLVQYPYGIASRRSGLGESAGKIGPCQPYLRIDQPDASKPSRSVCPRAGVANNNKIAMVFMAKPSPEVSGFGPVRQCSRYLTATCHPSTAGYLLIANEAASMALVMLFPAPTRIPATSNHPLTIKAASWRVLIANQ
jgi:hypothetical protein